MSLLDYWFHPTNQKKWFASNPIYDKEILNQFDHLVTSTFPIVINETTYNINNYLEQILIYDQLTRHYDRVHKTNIQYTGTKIATKIALYIIEEQKYDFLHLTTEQQCFVLLPLRHTRELYLVKRSISEIYQLMEQYFPQDNSTYYKACQNCLLNSLNGIYHMIGCYPDYYYEHNKIGSKIPNIYLKFYKASLECLATLMEPTHYPPIIDIQFPNDPIILDHKCQFDINTKIGYNKITKQTEKIPHDWIQEFQEILPTIGTKIIVSLSGGGDSMTVSYVLKQLGHDVTAVMIDYNNRPTCRDEVQMVHWWCSKLNIDLYVLHIDDIKRSRQACFREIYEPVTRQMRFNAYKKVAQMIGSPAHVVLGHNRDDSFENIISNLTKKRSMYNLKAIKPFHLENDVWIYRPFRNIIKANITRYLENVNGPYLYDSTPKWSFRGRTRDILVPQMNTFDPNLYSGLEDMADKIYDLSHRYFSLLEKNTKYDKTTAELQLFSQHKNTEIEVIKVSFMTDNYDDNSYWLYMFEQIMLRYNYPMIGNKAILNIINRINDYKKNNDCSDFVKVSLIRNLECRIFMKEGYMLVYLRPQKPINE